MNIPPFLERLLLSNEAEFKNASLGLSGQNMVFVPQGKTAVILELSIEPFCNAVQQDVLDLITSGYAENDKNPYYQAIRRIHYQVQIINDKYNSHLNFANDFEIINGYNSQTNVMTMSLKFTGKREELFIYIDRSIYFNFLFPYKENEIGPADTGIIPNYTTPATGFLPKIQNIPEKPVTFYKNTFQDYLVNAEINSAALDHYYSVNHQTNPAFGSELPQMEYLKLFNAANQSTIQQPLASNTALQWHDLMTLPVINVKYALLNKRPSDYGITTPGK